MSNKTVFECEHCGEKYLKWASPLRIDNARLALQSDEFKEKQKIRMKLWWDNRKAKKNAEC